MHYPRAGTFPGDWKSHDGVKGLRCMHLSGVGVELRRRKKLVVEITAALAGGQPERFREIASDVGADDWPELAGAMADEGVAFLVFYFIEKLRLGGSVPKDARNTLSGLYYGNLKRNLAIAEALKAVFLRFGADAISFIVLKGFALAACFYPGLATRGMSDADLLVRKGDVERANDSLTALGYTAADSLVNEALQNPPGYLASLDYRASDGSLPNIHIHWHTVNTSVPAYMFSENIDLDRMWEKAVSLRLAGAEARILCPEHQIVYLCEHGLRINHSFDRLILIYDIFYAIKAPRWSVDWDLVVGETRLFKIERLVFLSLSVVRRYAPPAVPDGVVQALLPPERTFWERAFLKLQLDNRRFRGAAMLVYFAMNNGIRAKAVFLFRTLFPPRRILLQRSYALDGKFSAVRYWRRVREVFLHLGVILRGC